MNTKFIKCFSFSLLHHILSSLHQRQKSCLEVHALFPFVLKSNINTENGDARICLNERLSCTIAANFLEILPPVHTWKFNVSCFEVLDASKVRFQLKNRHSCCEVRIRNCQFEYRDLGHAQMFCMRVTFHISVESFSCDMSLLTFLYCLCSLAARALSSVRFSVGFNTLSLVLLRVVQYTQSESSRVMLLSTRLTGSCYMYLCSSCFLEVEVVFACFFRKLGS